MSCFGGKYMHIQTLPKVGVGGILGNFAFFVGFIWNFVSDYIKNFDFISCKFQLEIKSYRQKFVWQTKMKCTVTGLWFWRSHYKIQDKMEQYTCISIFYLPRLVLRLQTRYRAWSLLRRGCPRRPWRCLPSPWYPYRYSCPCLSASLQQGPDQWTSIWKLFHTGKCF